MLNFDFHCDSSLLGLMIHMYDEKEECFIIGEHKLVPTLGDVAQIIGLPIDGSAVTGQDFNKSMTKAKCNDLLGSDVYVHEQGCDICLKKLKDGLMKVPDDVSEEVLKRHVRAHVLFFLGTVLMPSRRNKPIISSMYLDVLEDINKIKDFAWGAAFLGSCMSIIRETKTSAKKVCMVNLPSIFLAVFLGSYWPRIWKDVYCIGESQSLRLNEFPVAVQVTRILAAQSKNHKRTSKDKIRGLLRNASTIVIDSQPFRKVPLPAYLVRQWVVVYSHTRLICFEKVMNHNPQLCLGKLDLTSDEVCEFKSLKKTAAPKQRCLPEKEDYKTKLKGMVDDWDARMDNTITRNIKEYEFEADELTGNNESEAIFNGGHESEADVPDHLERVLPIHQACPLVSARRRRGGQEPPPQDMEPDNEVDDHIELVGNASQPSKRVGWALTDNQSRIQTRKRAQQQREKEASMSINVDVDSLNVPRRSKRKVNKPVCLSP